MPVIETTPEMVKKTYETSRKNLEVVRGRLKRPRHECREYVSENSPQEECCRDHSGSERLHPPPRGFEVR